MPITTQAFKEWSKSSNKMNLSSDDSVIRLAHEGITNFASLSDFGKKSIENFPTVCNNSVPTIETDVSSSIAAEALISGANMSSTLVHMLITAVNCTKNYGNISRTMTTQKIGQASVLATFKIECEACLSVKDYDESKVPKINEKMQQ